MTTLSIPKSLDRSIICFIAGIRTSHPSNPNLFSEGHFRARNASKLLKIMIDGPKDALKNVN